jgi:hypothetical protein
VQDVIKPLVIDSGRLDMRGYLRAPGKQTCNGGFRFVGNRMSFLNGEKAIDLEVEFHKHPIAGIARAQIMDATHAWARQHRVFYPAALVL